MRTRFGSRDAVNTNHFGKRLPRRMVATARGEAAGDTVVLPRYDIQASAGHGALIEHGEAADLLTVSREWLSRYVSKPAQVVVIEARGDSMEPTVRDGDLLLLDTGADIEAVSLGGVFVLSVCGMVVIKRLQIMPDGDLKVLSDNKAYGDQLIAAEELDDKVIVHGRVFWSGGPMSGRR